MTTDRIKVAVLKDIKKTYISAKSSNEVIKNVCLDIFSKELLVIMGPSGSGKSTLLNIIGRLDEPTSGSIEYYWSKELTSDKNSISHERGQNIGFIFQNFNLIPNYSVYENLLLPLYINSKVGVDSRRELVKSCLNLVGLEDKLEQSTNTLSGGEQQRIAIARSIINDPMLLLADEPTANVDKENEEKIIKIFLDIVRRGKTVVVITHNDIYKNYADRVFRLENGELVMEVK